MIHNLSHAAANGHLSVVQWLHCNRPEGCTREAVDNAAARAHLELAKWLMKIDRKDALIKGRIWQLETAI